VTAHLGPLATELAGFGLQNARPVSSRQLETGNWKIAMDTYMENYHVAFLHRETFALTAISNVSVVDYYGKHQRMVVPRKVLGSIKDPREVNDPHSAMALNYNIFPNIVLLVTPEMAMLSRIVPGRNVDHSITVQEFFSFGEFASEEQENMFKARVDLTYQAVSTEDYWITDGVQSGLRAGANETFLFGRNEVSLQNFHRQVDMAFDAFD
jgi:phenylpropionate dioxygenase-like ring-hydroxylating dioxygenase large terminal subunit